ncbi:MAG TPA: hypothetical protein VJR50_16320 [Mycobacterium sp.]|nr:hypothetical protein [Mycobacterium sp.]
MRRATAAVGVAAVAAWIPWDTSDTVAAPLGRQHVSAGSQSRHDALPDTDKHISGSGAPRRTGTALRRVREPEYELVTVPIGRGTLRCIRGRTSATRGQLSCDWAAFRGR